MSEPGAGSHTWFRVTDGERALSLDRQGDAGSQGPVLHVEEPGLIQSPGRSLKGLLID